MSVASVALRRGHSSPWPTIVAYALVAGATQMLWLTYAAITTDAARRYGVSVGAIGWLSEIFPLLYVVLALPAGWLLDRWFTPVLSAGALMVGAGGALRLVQVTFLWAMVGQVWIAVAQPIVLSAVSKLASEYLRESHRATGIALGSAGNLVGFIAALALGPALVAHGDLERVLVVEALIALVPVVVLIAALRRPGAYRDDTVVVSKGAARTLWARPAMRTLCGLVFLGFGLFVALATWLQTLLAPSGVSDTTAGLLLVGMVASGILGCAVCAPLVDARGAERGFLLGTVIVSVAGCVALALVSGVGGWAVVLVAMGLFLLPSLPVVLTAAERLAGPLAGMAGAIVWMAGNLGGLVVAVIVEALVHHPDAAFLAMGGVCALGLPVAARLRLGRD